MYIAKHLNSKRERMNERKRERVRERKNKKECNMFVNYRTKQRIFVMVCSRVVSFVFFF